MREESARTRFADIAGVVSIPIDGRLPLVVGGQAVNIWAVVYAPRVGSELRTYEPFVSNDLDLCGPRKILDELSKKYQVPIKLSPPRFPGIGQIVIPLGERKLKVELLARVRGVPHIGEENMVEIAVEGVHLRVLDPISCLKAKISNAADIDQTDRQDVKHVEIMKICAGEYAKDVVAGKPEVFGERVVVKLLERLRETITSTGAQKVAYKWGISFDNVLPSEAIQRSKMPRVQNFLRYRLGQAVSTRASLRNRPGGHGMGM